MSNEDKCESKSNAPSETKSSSVQKLFSPTIRLTISLREPDDEFCSVFNYISLLSEEKRKRRSEREKIGGKQNIDTSEEIDDEAKKLAAHFEEKYGNGTSKKKKKKKVTTFYNYTELASGYDENDSFIDNSEAFDEALPDEMETFHGGYYVNCGQLEFKKVETVDENSEAEELRTSKKKTTILRSDDSNDDDFSKSESNSGESETEDVVNEAKKLPEENDQKAVERESTKNIVPLSKNQDKLPADKSNSNNPAALTNGVLALKKKKKYKKRRISDDTEAGPKKKGRTVKILLEEKRVLDNSRTSCETEKENHVEEMDVAEPVVNDSVVTNITKELFKLPDNLPQDILIMVSQLKAVAHNSESGARTFFNTPNNCKLLSKLDEKTRSLTTSCRLGVYTYLANFLPCSKETLMKRARQFLIGEEDEKIKELLNKLKSCIDKVMPQLFEKYTASYKNAEENMNGASKNNQFDENNLSQRLPSKTFVWSDEMRNYLHESAMCHIRCLNLLKPKKESVDERLMKFLETKVKPLWPNGWMDTSTLLTEARIKTVSSTSKKAPRTNNAQASAKKSQLPVPSSNNLSPSSVSVSSAAYNLLTNSLALQSLSMQYSQPDSIYSAAAVAGSTTTSIPYRSDLTLIPSGGAATSTLPFSLDVLSRFTGPSAATQAFPITSTTTITTATNANPYSKSDNFKNQNGTAKPVHLNLKQRILQQQQSIMTGNPEVTCSIFKDVSAKPQISILPNHVQNDSSANVGLSKNLDDRKGRSSPAVREEKRSSLLDGKQVINNKKLASVTFSEVIEVIPRRKKSKSVSLVRSSSANSFFDVQLKVSKKKIPEKKSKVVRTKSLDEKKRRSPLLGREEKRSALPKDLKITETTTATDFLSKIINDSLQEGSNHSRISAFVNSTFDSLERKLDRDSRDKEKNYETEIRLLPPSKESPLRPPDKTFIAPSAERKQPSPSDRIGGQKVSFYGVRDLSVVVPRSRISGDHRPEKKSDRDGRDKERSLNCESEIQMHFASKESHRHHADKRVGSASADRKMAGSSSGNNDDVINDLMKLNRLGGHSIPRRMEQMDAAYNSYNSNTNELNGAGSEALNHSSPSSSSKPRTSNSPFQDEFRKHIFKTDTGNS